MDKKVTWCDPPSGWRYGFPKPIPEGVLSGGNFEKWLREEGYPDKLREEMGNHFYCRFWEESGNE